MFEYPPDVSVLSPSGAELGDDSDCRRDDDGRTGVERSAEPDPGAWTAEEVMPAVYDPVSMLLRLSTDVFSYLVFRRDSWLV